MSAASGNKRRRRRHTLATHRPPDQLNDGSRRRRLSATQTWAAGAVVIICVALIALVWINTARAVREEADDLHGRIEAAVAVQATTLANQAEHELLMIDQSLTILQAAWNADPQNFKLVDWQKKMPALSAVADDVFVANDSGIIVQDIVPAAIGQGIGSAYVNFANGSLEPIRVKGSDNGDSAMLVGELGSGGVIRQYLMYLVRPLQNPRGWLIGASYRSKALTEVFVKSGLGHGGLAALIDTHRGGVQALAGAAAVRPTLLIENTPLYRAMLARPGGGIWDGVSPIDGVDRILAFRRVRGRDLIVLIGVATAEAMSPASTWADAARSLASLATLLVLAIGGAILWEMWHWRRIRRRQRALSQAQALLIGVQSELAAMRLRTAVTDAQLQTVLGVTVAGIAIVDPEHRLTAWNSRFAELRLVPPDSLREGLLLDELLRQQIMGRQSEPPENLEREVSSRLVLLRPEAGSGTLAATGLDGSDLVMRAQPTPDGGLVIVVQGAAEAESHVEEPTTAGPVEW